MARPGDLPPADAPDMPHLTWIFVEPWAAGLGVGTALLAVATRALWPLGYRELGSTIVRGNDAALAWHWRNGFRLLPSATSGRRLRQLRSRERDRAADRQGEAEA